MEAVITHSRRIFVRSTLLAAPALVCAALPALAALPDGRLDDALTLERRRAACPFCRPDNPCPEHLF